MSFSIQISSDLIAVEAGDNTPVNLMVSNSGDEMDRVEVEVEGLDAEWTAVPVPIFTVQPHESKSERIFFRPGRASESIAANYPFIVKVRSLNSGEARQVQGVLQIKPYNHLSMEITPKKGAISPLRGEEIFHASIMNLGNTDQMLQIFGSDTEDAFAFEFGQEQVSVGPGQQKEIEIRATPTKSRPFASPRLHVFTISARSIQTPSLVASSQAQLEQRPLLTPTSAIVLFLVFLLGLFWVYSRPQPPDLQTLLLDPQQQAYDLNTKITVSWHAVNANKVRLTIYDQTFTEPATGTTTFQASKSGTVQAVAYSDRTESKPLAISFDVIQPKEEPPASIESFEISPRSINLGKSVIVKYKVSNTTKLVLLPSANILLDPTLDSYEFTPTQSGTTNYYLVAENASLPGKPSHPVKSKEISVRVTEASAAHIVFFGVDATTVDPLVNDRVTIKWQTTDAAKVVLSINGATKDLIGPSGDDTEQVDRNTEFVLIAYDSKGLTTHSKKVFVKIKPPPTPPVDNTTTGLTTGGGTNSGGAPTGNNNPPPPTTGAGG